MGEPPARLLARPPVIRPDQGGCGDTVLALAPGHDRPRPAVLPAVREGRGLSGLGAAAIEDQRGHGSAVRGTNTV
jgi:hypothetical protein